MAAPIETSPNLKPANPQLERCLSPLSQASTGLDDCFSRTVSQETAPGSMGGLMLPESLDSLRGCLEDGPALTPDGRALDLDGGVAIFFSCAEELSESHEAKLQAKTQARLVRAMQVAHSLCEAEQRMDRGEIASIGPDGTVHGVVALEPPASGGARLKRFFHKRCMAAARRRGPLAAFHLGALCPDSDGKVSVYLYLNREADRRERRHQRLAAKAFREAQDPTVEVKVLIVDRDGTIRGCRDLCRAPPVIPAC